MLESPKMPSNEACLIEVVIFGELPNEINFLQYLTLKLEDSRNPILLSKALAIKDISNIPILIRLIL